MLTLENFETEIEKKIVHRGWSYYESDAVENLEENSAGTWQAIVEGGAVYEVEVVLYRKKIKTANCNCPYDGGPICKHIVALLYALREQAAMPEKKAKRLRELGFEDVLLKTNLEELRDFVRHQKKGNRDFGDKFLLYFADKDPALDVSAKYVKLVKQIVRSHSDRGFMDYRQTFSFSKEIQPVFDAVVTAISGKNYRDAFSIAKILSKETVQLIQSSDDSAGNIGGLAFSSIALLKEIALAKDVSPELSDQLFAYLLECLKDRAWFDYGDFGYEILPAVEAIARRTEPQLYLDVLDNLLAIHVGDYSNYKQNFLKKSKIRYLESIGQLAEAKALAAENMDIVEVRQWQVEKAIDKKEFLQAKQLIYDGIKIAEDKGHPGTVRNWELILLKIAELEEDMSMIRHFNKKHAFDRGFHEEYYSAWKATFSPSEWTAVIEQYIQTVFDEEESKPRRAVWDNLNASLFSRLSQVFIQEEMWERLLSLVAEGCNETMLSTVHPYLAKRYPKETLDLYLALLTELADQVNDRSGYQRLTSLMKKVKQDIELSHAPIDELVMKLMQKYTRRPAMQEELNKVIKPM